MCTWLRAHTGVGHTERTDTATDLSNSTKLTERQSTSDWRRSLQWHPQSLLLSLQWMGKLNEAFAERVCWIQRAREKHRADLFSLGALFTIGAVIEREGEARGAWLPFIWNPHLKWWLSNKTYYLHLAILQYKNLFVGRFNFFSYQVSKIRGLRGERLPQQKKSICRLL